MSVDPGAGYRLLVSGERLIEGDQFMPLAGSGWAHIADRRIGNRIDDLHVPHRRKIEGATGIEAIVCADIAARQRAGIAKYGTTVKDNPLSLKEWLQHAYEECLDQAVYLRRAIDEL